MPPNKESLDSFFTKPELYENQSGTLSQPVKEKLEKLRWTASEIQRVDSLVSGLRKIPGCAKIWLYGSMARGTQDSNPAKRSDIDLAVEIDEGTFQNDMFRKDLQLEGLRDVQLNFIPVGYDEQIRDSLKEDDVFYDYDEESGTERTVYRVDYLTVRSSQDARARLRDQIVLWARE